VKLAAEEAVVTLEVPEQADRFVARGVGAAEVATIAAASSSPSHLQQIVHGWALAQTGPSYCIRYRTLATSTPRWEAALPFRIRLLNSGESLTVVNAAPSANELK